MTARAWRHVPLGRLGYDEAWRRQTSARAALLSGADEAADVIFTVEHPPVLTAGRRARPENLLRTAAELADQGVAVRALERGGDWTYHGPGQLVAYPVVSLTARRLPLKEFVGGLEAAMIAIVNELFVAAGRADLQAVRRGGFPGAWVVGEADARWKIGAVGVHVAHGVTLHGLALNLDLQPDGFRFIVPCGLSGERTTSVAALIGQSPPPEALAARLFAALVTSLSGAPAG